MTAKLATIALASLTAAACASTSSAVRAPAQLAGPIGAVALAADEEAADEWAPDCRQELGIDSGDAQRAHELTEDEWVSGCFVEGDDLDGFVLDVSSPAIYQISLIHRGGASLATQVNDVSTEVLEGSEFSGAFELSAGRHVIRIAKSAPVGAAWYRLKASVVTQVASR